jgi:4-amino-4-deoxy-L-arabinose transferase-like glycosyltransferase
LVIAIVGLAVLGYTLFFHRLADRDLWSSHEARAGMDAQTLLDGDTGGLPRLFDGQPELQKPPLYYWLVAAVARLRGGDVDAWAVRLPAALAAAGCVLAVCAGLSVRRRPAAGLMAAAILATAAHFVWLARIGRIDMPLTLAVTAAAGSFYLARRRRRLGRTAWHLLVGGYVAVALGVLLKGPIGAVLPGAILLAHLGIEGDLRPRQWLHTTRELGLGWGLLLVLALTLPCFLWADAATRGEFTRVFFWHHNLGRGLGGTGLRTNPWWFYLPQFFGDFLPWSALVPLAAWWCWRRRCLRRDPDARFGLAWLVAVLLVLSCSRFKRADYLLPAYPGAALFLGCVWHRQVRRWRFSPALIPAVAALVLAAWLVRLEWLLPQQEPFRDYRAFAAAVRQRVPRPGEVVFFQTEAHALAFHVGRPLAVVVQWEELAARLARPGAHGVVLPPDSLREWAQHLPGIRLHEVLRNTDLSGGRHERPLVLLWAGPITDRSEDRFSSLSHARAAEAAADRLRTAERGAAGP